MRIFGIDYGDKKIGIAFGESDVGVAVPVDVIQNTGPGVFVYLAQRVKAEGADLIVVGAPLSTGAHHGPEQLEKTRTFIRGLQAATAIPIVEEDESYTTAESIRLQREEGAEADEDALAAMLIIQSYMDRTGSR
jgi:putative Holliday junction resolvase